MNNNVILSHGRLYVFAAPQDTSDPTHLSTRGPFGIHSIQRYSTARVLRSPRILVYRALPYVDWDARRVMSLLNIIKIY
jgi:hypothetical protein